MSRKIFPAYRGHWLHGSFPEYRLDPLGFYVSVWNELGDYSRIRMTASKSLRLLAHPDAIEHVLLKNQENYEKPPERKMLFEGSLLTSGEAEARAKRKLIQPSYRTSHSEHARAVVLDSTRQFLERVLMSPDGLVDINSEMTRLTLQVASITLFDRDLSDPEEQIDQTIQQCIRYMSQMGEKTLTPARLPFSRERRSFQRARAELHSLLAEIIREHESSDHADILAQIMARDEKALLNPVENAFLLLLASYLTMSQVFQFAFRKLSECPEIQEKAFQEINATLGERDPEIEDLKSLPFVSAVFGESMRLFPNFHLFYHARKDDEINGYAIPAGTRVCLSSYVTHRHPEFWDEPTEFDPERFLKKDVIRHKFAYFPFGGGPRICLGKSFALLEGPLVIAAVLQQCRVEALDGQPYGPLKFFKR